MSDLFKTLRLALYVIALPLAVTAVVSAESFFSASKGIVDDSDFEVIAESAPVALDVAHASMNYILNIDKDGGVSGQIMSQSESGLYGAAGMDISLNRQGRVMSSATTGSDGVFRFEHAAPGPYTFIATSPDSITTFGVYVFENGATTDAGEVQFSVAATNSNTQGVRDILNADVDTVAYTYLPGASEIFVTDGISQVSLSEDSSITGRLAPLFWQDTGQVFDLTGTQVYLLNSSGVVANTTANADGSYLLENVQPGIYDFVSFGPSGAAAFSVEVTANDSVAANSKSNTTFASTRTAAPIKQGLDVILSEPTSGAPVVTTVEVMVRLPQAAGGAPGGYGGGGGGGGGFGDWGGIISAALGAWVISELINSDNNNNNVITPPIIIPPPTSPF